MVNISAVVNITAVAVNNDGKVMLQLSMLLHLHLSLKLQFAVINDAAIAVVNIAVVAVVIVDAVAVVNAEHCSFQCQCSRRYQRCCSCGCKMLVQLQLSMMLQLPCLVQLKSQSSNIANKQTVSKAYIPPAVAIRGYNNFIYWKERTMDK